MARTEKIPIQTFGPVTIHRKPGNGNRRIIDTTYVLRLNGETIRDVGAFSDEYQARSFARGFAMGHAAGKSEATADALREAHKMLRHIEGQAA